MGCQSNLLATERGAFPVFDVSLPTWICAQHVRDRQGYFPDEVPIPGCIMHVFFGLLCVGLRTLSCREEAYLAWLGRGDHVIP